MTHLISSVFCVNAPVFFRGFAFAGKNKFNRSSEKADLPVPDAMSDSIFRPSVRQCLYVRKPAFFMCRITPFIIAGDKRENSDYIVIPKSSFSSSSSSISPSSSCPTPIAMPAIIPVATPRAVPVFLAYRSRFSSSDSSPSSRISVRFSSPRMPIRARSVSSELPRTPCEATTVRRPVCFFCR